MIKDFCIVGFGGALGSMMRYGISLITASLLWSPLVGTLTANVLGSMLIGAILAVCKEGSLALFLTIGICGGFTTFSTFSFQSLSLLHSGRYSIAIGYILASITVCLLASWLGFALCNKIKI